MGRSTFPRRSVLAAILTALTLILMAGSTFAAPAANGVTTDHFLIRNATAIADWWSDHPNQCGYTHFSITAGDVTPVAGSYAGNSNIYASYEDFDPCQGTYFYGSGYDPLPDGAFKLTGPNPYFSASLSPVTVMLDVYQSDAMVPLIVSANWSSSTLPSRYNNMISNGSPSMRLVIRTLGTDAPATATGTLALGSGTPLSFVTSDGYVSKDSNGWLTITHR